MTISTSYFNAPTTSALLNGTRIDICHQTPIAPTKSNIENAENRFSRLTTRPKYGIARWVDAAKDKLGARVFLLPENFKGVSDERRDETFESVGTLVKQFGRWFVLTDEQEVENLRRSLEINRMRKGALSIGQYGNDADAYAVALANKDAQNGTMVTRGHGIEDSYFN